jgi:hypothetical protein
MYNLKPAVWPDRQGSRTAIVGPMRSFCGQRTFLNATVGFLLVLGGAGCAAVDDLSATLSKEWARLTSPKVPSTAKQKLLDGASANTAQLVPQKLIGLDQQEVKELLGTATHTREVAPAVVWEYRQKACALDIFFYLDLASQRFRALAYDMKSADGNEDRTLALCLYHFRERDRGGKG